MFETFLLNQLVIDWYILDSLEKGYLYTQLLKLSQKLIFFWVGLDGSCESLWKGWNRLWSTFLRVFLILWGRRLAIWKGLSRSQIDLLDLHSIGRA